MTERIRCLCWNGVINLFWFHLFFPNSHLSCLQDFEQIGDWQQYYFKRSVAFSLHPSCTPLLFSVHLIMDSWPLPFTNTREYFNDSKLSLRSLILRTITHFAFGLTLGKWPLLGRIKKLWNVPLFVQTFVRMYVWTLLVYISFTVFVFLGKVNLFWVALLLWIRY